MRFFLGGGAIPDLLGGLGFRLCWSIARRADWAIRGIAISFFTSLRLASWNSSCLVFIGFAPLRITSKPSIFCSIWHITGNRFNGRLWTTVAKSPAYQLMALARQANPRAKGGICLVCGVANDNRNPLASLLIVKISVHVSALSLHCFDEMQASVASHLEDTEGQTQLELRNNRNKHLQRGPEWTVERLSHE
jgi:hypothetical protein